MSDNAIDLRHITRHGDIDNRDFPQWLLEELGAADVTVGTVIHFANASVKVVAENADPHTFRMVTIEGAE
jgi:hypothetical protein